MTDPFTRHGIDHLSASSLNLWKASPGLFARRYVAGVRDEGNAATWRGTAVENGYAAYLRGAPVADALKVALRAFQFNALGEITPEIEAEAENVAPMLMQAVAYGKPEMLLATQIRVEHWFENIPIPVIGFVDFAFEGLDLDLKTTKACPSEPRGDHVRQVSLYRAARKRAGGLLYVTAKKKAFYQVDDALMARALEELEEDARSLLHFLDAFPDRASVCRALPIDWEHWSAPKERVPLAKVLATNNNTIPAKPGSIPALGGADGMAKPAP
jgi:hypothetical protein